MLRPCLGTPPAPPHAGGHADALQDFCTVSRPRAARPLSTAQAPRRPLMAGRGGADPIRGRGRSSRAQLRGGCGCWLQPLLVPNPVLPAPGPPWGGASGAWRLSRGASVSTGRGRHTRGAQGTPVCSESSQSGEGGSPALGEAMGSERPERGGRKERLGGHRCHRRGEGAAWGHDATWGVGAQPGHGCLHPTRPHGERPEALRPWG